MVIELFQILTCLTLGLLIGSLLTEATILVPYWRTMDPEVFLDLHHTLGPKLMAYFAPLTIIATILPLITALLPIVFGKQLPWLPFVTVFLTQSMLLIYFGYFKGANESFKTGDVGVERLADELSKWAKWHWLRVVVGFVAFTTSILVIHFPS